jgi:RNA polymerase sigma factor (sigma-70 family)
MGGVHPDGDVVLRSLYEPEAFGELFDRHFDDVRRYFARRVDADSATDLAAEVFRLGFERRRTFDPQRSGSCRPWLFGIARNVLAKEWNRIGRRAALRARLHSSLDPVAPGDAFDDSVDALDAASRWRTVATALAHMDDDSRELLLLVAWDSLTYEEVAQVFAVPVGTIRSRLSRARSLLSHLVADEAPTKRNPLP